MSPAEPALVIEGLRTEISLRERTVQAVNGVDLAIAPGETVGLVGESGSGKSMVGLSILQLLPPGGRIVGGDIRVGGRSLIGMGEDELMKVRGGQVGMVFQDPLTSPNPTLTIGRQLAEPIRRHLGGTKQSARARAEEMLALAGIPSPRRRMDDYPHQLSGGMRQRMMIAMALACEPKVLIADEPTTALDVTTQEQIMELLEDLKQRLGMAVLLITHDMGIIASHATRLAVMYAGKIVESGGTDEIFSSMRHRYTEALLGSIVDLDQDVTQPLISIPGMPPDLAGLPRGCSFAPRCGFATDECLAATPPVSELGGHAFTCYNPVEAGSEAPEVAPIAAVIEAAEAEAEDGGGPGSPLLEVTDLVKEFPLGRGFLTREPPTVKAVSGISFSVEKGEIFGLVGESGSGKSTLASMLVGLEKPTAGSVGFDGAPVVDLSRVARKRLHGQLQLMFQDPYGSLDPRMTVGSIIAEPLVIQGVGERSGRAAEVDRLLGEVGLAPRDAGRYPHEFSGGQRQRVGLARALALNPRLVVADEPVSALDVSVRAQILNLMKALQVAHQLTYVVISHDLAVVKYLVDRIGVMYLGKLVEVGPSAPVAQAPIHPYTAGLIEAVPVPDPKRARRVEKKAKVKGEPPSAIDPPSGCRFRTRCPYAQDVCAAEEPPLRPFGDGRLAACHFPLRPPA
jgi:oligopeptide/dipeptide ABC transporter ATP-binding protein